MSENLSSATVVNGALRVNQSLMIWEKYPHIRWPPLNIYMFIFVMHMCTVYLTQNDDEDSDTF